MQNQKKFCLLECLPYNINQGADMKPSIIVFSTPTCSWCKKLKSYLRENSFIYKDIDVSKDTKALNDMIKKTGQQGVPQTWINGTPIIGFDRAKIDKLLGINKQTIGEKQ
jgi:glutaredoxin-like YruB-family protein